MNLASGAADGIREDSHQADVTAAVDQAGAALREEPAEFRRGLRVRRMRAAVRLQ